MGRRIRIDTGYRPRPCQAEIHRALKRFNVLVCHRRFGKTVLAVNELVDRALRLMASGKTKPRLAYIAPLYRQAKGVAWDYLKTFTASIPERSVNEAELRIDLLGGARITLYGADNPDALRGLYFDFAVLDEPAQMRPRFWPEIVRPALADREGGALFIGTPMGRNAFWDVYDRATRDPDWYAGLYRASETGILPADELAAARSVQTPEQYEQEFECSFQAAIIGAYYGREMAAAEREGRITRVPWDPAVKVHTCWDLGNGLNMVIWFFQLVGQEVRWIDYADGFNGLPDCVKLMQQKPYVYGRHLLPHDVAAIEIGSGVTRQETLRSLGVLPEVCSQQSVDDGINAVRLLLPRSWFDAEKCGRGLEALRQYRSEYDEKGQTLRPRPVHDWTSHAADALRTGAMNLPPVNDDWGGPLKVNTGWVR